MLVLDFDQLFFRYGQERSDRGGGCAHTPGFEILCLFSQEQRCPEW